MFCIGLTGKWQLVKDFLKSNKKTPQTGYLSNNIYFFVITSKCIFLQPIQTKFYYHVRHCNKSKKNNC